MSGPRVPDNAFTERDGIIAVDLAVNAARCIWRETSTRDVGIDGQIEYVNADGVATGRIVAVQVKSGTSYFANATGAYVPYHPSDAHKAYWERHPIPVVLALHHPERGETYWADARAALRNGQPIRVPLSQRLDPAGVHAALASDGPLPQGEEDLASLVDLMMETCTGDADFDVSVFDLFFQGLTDIAHSLYFGMDLPREIQDVKAALPGGTGRIVTGPTIYEFFDTYVAFLIAHDLARVDFNAWRRMAERFQMVGSFVCPLTFRGEAVVDFVHHLDVRHLPGHGGYHVVAQERSVMMDMRGVDERVLRIEEFKKAFRSRPQGGTGAEND